MAVRRRQGNGLSNLCRKHCRELCRIDNVYDKARDKDISAEEDGRAGGLPRRSSPCVVRRRVPAVRWSMNGTGDGNSCPVVGQLYEDPFQALDRYGGVVV